MDWTLIVTLASITGTVANIYKKRWCYIIWLFTNSFWCVYDAIQGLWTQTILFAVYVLLAVWGLIQWSRSRDQKGKMNDKSRI